MTLTRLHDYLQARAERDYTAVTHIIRVAREGTPMSRDIAVLKQYDQWMRIFDPQVVQKMRTITLATGALEDASLYLLSVAGEAIKKIEKQVPDIHERCPNFPWKSFKKIRDLNMHLGEHVVDSPSYIDSCTKIRAAVGEINARRPYDLSAKEYDGVPYMQLAGAMLNWAMAIDEFRQTSPGNPVVVKSGPQMSTLSKKLGMDEANIPLFIYTMYTFNSLCMVNDQLKAPSQLFKATYSPLYQEANRSTLKTLRNSVGHFDEFFNAYDRGFAQGKSGKEGIQLDLDFFNNSELMPLQKFYRAVPGILKNLYQDYVRDAGVNGIDELRERYEIKILGDAISDPQKRTLIDKEVAWITNTTYPDIFKDCYLMAAGKMLSKYGVAEAQETLQFLHSNHDSLRKPETLKTKAGASSMALQQRVMCFSDAMQKANTVTEARTTTPG